jgi:SAM-dependent methyltransferase
MRSRENDGKASMPNSPRVWHYGLMAEYWAEFLTSAPEAAFYKGAVARFGQPVLDLACGAGRLTLPLLRAGIDVDGCDISPDMIRLAGEAASREGFDPALYVQAMHELDLPRRYRTICICGGIGLGGGREADLECLRRCLRHLEPGGALVFNAQMEYASRESWEAWLPESRAALPQPWPERGAPRTARDGSEHYLQMRVVDVDPLEQTYTREARLEKWVGGQCIAAESHSLRGAMYLKPELVLMLQVAGFSRTVVSGGYSAEAATAESGELVFTAIR